MWLTVRTVGTRCRRRRTCLASIVAQSYERGGGRGKS